MTPPVDPVELFPNVLKMLMEPNVYASVDLKENWFLIILRVHNKTGKIILNFVTDWRKLRSHAPDAGGLRVLKPCGN